VCDPVEEVPVKLFLVFLLVVFFTACFSRTEHPKAATVPLLVACAVMAGALSYAGLAG
jgi:hypothetical protein